MARAGMGRVVIICTVLREVSSHTIDSCKAGKEYDAGGKTPQIAATTVQHDT